ncbi:hypothetical protein [Phenylobacterium soli]|nr:hypothetical protein [Phenylobacterium soli]
MIAGAGACAVLGGCAGNPFQDAKVDPASPVAAEVAKVAHANRAYPTFASIPPAPKDVRPAGQYGRQAKAVEQERAQLEQDTAPQTWSLGGTEGFAAQARREAGSEAAPQESGEAAAFANSQRKRATPPPPPQR